MTTTDEFRVLLDHFTATYETLDALLRARHQQPGETPVLIDPSDESLIIAQANYEDAWKGVSKAANSLFGEVPATPPCGVQAIAEAP